MFSLVYALIRGFAKQKQTKNRSAAAVAAAPETQTQFTNVSTFAKSRFQLRMKLSNQKINSRQNKPKSHTNGMAKNRIIWRKTSKEITCSLSYDVTQLDIIVFELFRTELLCVEQQYSTLHWHLCVTMCVLYVLQ